MKPGLRSTALILALLSAPFSSASAEETLTLADSTPPPFAPSLKMSGLVFSNFQYTPDQKSKGPSNQFSIERVYLNLRTKMTRSFSARVTTDVGPVNQSKDQKIRPFLKYAYVQYQGLSEGLKLRVGAAATGFIDKFDEFVGHRWVSKAFTDQEEMLTSSDLGFHLLGEHGGGKLEYQLSLVNGGGIDQLETNEGKAIQLRLTEDLMAGTDLEMPMSIFISENINPTDAPSEKGESAIRLLGASMGLKGRLGVLWTEYVIADDGAAKSAGYSITVQPEITSYHGLYARLDNLDPNIALEGDSSMRALGGLTYDFADKISAGLFYERTMPEKGAASYSVYLKTQAGF